MSTHMPVIFHVFLHHFVLPKLATSSIRVKWVEIIACCVLILCFSVKKLLLFPSSVDIVREKLDPEQLGIILLNNFMEEFFPEERDNYLPESFILYHYNGLKRSCVANKVILDSNTTVIRLLTTL